MTAAKQLLVPLRGGDRIEEILPYVQDVAQPGMTVVFLVHFGSNRFHELATRLLMINTGLPLKFHDGAGADRLSNIDQRINDAAEEVRQGGVAIKVKFYTGSWRRLVRQSVEDEPVQWVIMRSARSRLLRSCYALAAALRVACAPAPAPVFLLFNPNSMARR